MPSIIKNSNILRPELYSLYSGMGLAKEDRFGNIFAAYVTLPAPGLES